MSALKSFNFEIRSAAMIICTRDVANECPESGQVCTLSDRTRCCQNILRGLIFACLVSLDAAAADLNKYNYSESVAI